MRALAGAMLVGAMGVAGAQPTRGTPPAATSRAGAEVALAAMDIDHKDTTDVAPGAGRFRSLRLRALHGGAYIDFVEVRYANGERQHVAVGRSLARDESADIDLNGRRDLQAITVRGTPDPDTRVEVIGLR